uniref:DUF1289 domain-containing protein n=1 Tax=Pararhizobium sp. IMCC3301 TaxID=3067904 RepID=UPI0027408470|nr:DUF1289 domain-containing protein [Pararhizobium sp. IMCC3301]
MKSPCVNICLIDEPTRQCLGCGRSLREISGWSQMNDAERDAIMKVLPHRLQLLPQVTS